MRGPTLWVPLPAGIPAPFNHYALFSFLHSPILSSLSTLQISHFTLHSSFSLPLIIHF